MASVDENIALATETAEVILNAIKSSIEEGYTSPDHLKAAAEAYATVREAMPKARGRAAAL